MALSPAQIGQYAQAAGYRGNAATIAVAVALAESGGNPTATHRNSDGSTDYGLWQINSVHSQYSPSLLLSSPLYNAQAAYAISSGGTNWNPWATYTNGAYLRYMSSTIPASGVKPWYTFPRIDKLGSPDPYGGFPKPDSNIQLPDGYPVTALLPGTVSGTDSTSSWACSVTVALDSPLNSLATHTSYLHLGSIAVRRGQHVNAGDLIGTNGGRTACGSQKVPLGFALYPGANYGYGSAWGSMTTANLTGGGPLNPVPLLNRFASGSGSVGTIPLGVTTGLTSSYVPLLQQIHETLVDTPGFYGIALALDEAEQFPGWIDLTQPLQWDIAGSSLEVPDIPGEVRSIGATITENFLPFAIRSGLVLLGSILLIGLLTKGVGGSLGELAPLLAA